MEYINYAVCDDEEIILDAVFDRVFTIFKRAGMIATGRKYRSSKAFLEDVTRQTGHDELNLAFLDIDMPELNGIELGRAIKEKNPKIEIIFVSNRYEKVFDTFDIHPFGFVRKNNFSADIGKTLKAYIAARGKDENYFVVQQENNSVTQKLPITDIVYVESLKNHQFIHMVNGSTVDVRMTMDELEKGLVEHDILRAHKGYLVNLKYITRIEPTGIELATGEVVLVSRRKVGEIKTALLMYLRKTGALVFD